jgi:hypothetical protein
MAFTNKLVAQVTDSFGNLVPGASVTFAAPTSGASATFASTGCTANSPTTTCSATTDASGRATSSTFTANTTSGGYTVAASVGGVTPSASFSETNNPGAAFQLGFTPATPGPGTAGVSIQSVAVSVEDSFGNVVTTQNTGSVTISIKSGSPQTSFTSGTTTKSVSGGVATFTNLVVNTSGSYTFTATPTSISGVTAAVNSNAFTVNAGAINSLTLSPSTSTPTTGTAFTVSITALDPFGNTANNYTGTQCITFSGPTNSPNGTTPTYPASGTCSSGSAVTFSNGVASGTNAPSVTLVAATKPSTVTLTATDNPSGKTGTTSLTVSAGAAHGLAFTNCSVSSGNPPSCSAFGGPSTITVTKKTGSSGNNSGTWTANATLIDQYGNTATNGGSTAITATAAFTPAGSDTASIAYSSGSSLTIAPGASQSSNTFAFQPTSNGAVAPFGTVTASSAGLSSISATVNTG